MAAAKKPPPLSYPGVSPDASNVMPLELVQNEAGELVDANEERRLLAEARARQSEEQSRLANAEREDAERARVAEQDAKNWTSARSGGGAGGASGTAPPPAQESPGNVPSGPEENEAKKRLADAAAAAAADTRSREMRSRVPGGYDPMRAFEQPRGGAAVVSRGGWQPGQRSMQVTTPPPLDPRVADEIEYSNHQRRAAVRTEAGIGAKEAGDAQAFSNEAASAHDLLARKEAHEQKAGMSERRAVIESLREQVASLGAKIETPHDRMQQWDTGKKMGFLLASAMSGGAGWRQGRNAFLEQFNKFADQDIKKLELEAQAKRDRLGASEQLFSMLQRSLGSEAAAREALRAMYWDGFKSRMEQASREMGIDKNNVRIGQLFADVADKHADALMKLSAASGSTTVTQGTERYVPPSVIQVGQQMGMKEGEAAARWKDYVEQREKKGLPVLQTTLNLARSALEAAPPGMKGFIQHYLGQHPGGTMGEALRAYVGSGDPDARRNMSLVNGAFVNHMRSTGGKALTESEKQLEYLSQDPVLFAGFYSNIADEYTQKEADARLILGPAGPRMMEMIDRTRDQYTDAPGTTARAIGSEVYESALPTPAWR